VTDKLAKRRQRRLGVAAVFLLVLAAILGAPFLLTTRLVNFALAQVFPGNRPSVGSATLSLAGTLVLRDLLLHDTGPLARQPLVMAREIDAAFGWRELLTRQIRRIRAENVIVYARSNGPSQLSLLDLLFELSKPRSSAASSRGSRPLWVGTFDVQGLVHLDAVRRFAPANSDLPMGLQMSMSGNREQPSRHFLVVVGEVRQMTDEIPEEPRVIAIEPAPQADVAFGLRADVETQPAAEGTRVIVHRLATSQADITIEADRLRQFVAALPREVQGSIETGVANLWASGELDPSGLANGKQLSGKLVFAGLRVRLPGSSRMMVRLDDLTGVAKINTPLPPGPGTAVTIERLQAKDAKASIEVDTVRHYVATLPPELQGRIETSLGNLFASGKLDLQQPANHDHLAGSLAFSGLRMRITDSPQMMVSFDDLQGAAGINTNLPPETEAAITIKRVQVKNTKASIETDILRRYIKKLPASLHGRIEANLEVLDASGLIGSEAKHPTSFRGNIGLHNLSSHLPVGAKNAFSVDRLTAAASVDSRLDRWEPATLKVHDGVTQWSGLTYGDNAVNNFDASWRIESQMLTADRLAAQIFDGHVSGSPQWDLVTHAMPRCDFQIKSIDMHAALANASPEHLDAEGNASGSLHMALSKEGELSGYVDLAFDGPGTLRIGQIEEVKQMLVGNFGADMANMAMHDLAHYPFKEGKLHLESLGENSQMKIKFVRQPRTAADKTPPHKEIINGKEVWVGSLVVPTIDMTIPISGKSFAEILSMISGLHPLIQAVSQQPEK
jgi:dicarboxylate transporter DctA-like protein